MSAVNFNETTMAQQYGELMYSNTAIDAGAFSNDTDMTMMSLGNGQGFAAPAKNAGKGDDQVMFKTQLCRGFLAKGRCPYEYMCMYAHGPQELRTKQMNLSEGLTSAGSVRSYQWRLKAAGYTTRNLGRPATNSGPSSMAGSPTSAFAAPWAQQGASFPSAAPSECACAECFSVKAQIQARACPCVECVGAAQTAAAAVGFVSHPCRFAASRAAQAQAELCPCPECIDAARVAAAAAAAPCPCPDCGPVVRVNQPYGCGEASSSGSMAGPTPGVSTSASSVDRSGSN